MNNNNAEQYKISKDKWNTFQWYVDSLGWLPAFGLSLEDKEKLDKALDQIESILDKFEKED